MQSMLRVLRTSLFTSFSSSGSFSLPVGRTAFPHREVHLQVVLCRRKMPTLTADDRKSLLEPLLSKGWIVQEKRDAIYKEFQFKDFKEAFKFMAAIALKADEMDHHPEWFNVYNKVNITLSSHDCNGLSKRDVTLANIIEESQNALKG